MSIQIQIGADVSGVNKAIQDASKSLNNLKAPAANAQNALFSLNQVARDLPFGFIAIQNNLPLVFDSFSNLTKEAGGLSGGLKALGASLIGPAGISFAVSAVISGVTALIQKYGSLSNAFDAIILGNGKFIETQKTLTKAIAEASGNVVIEETKLKILVNTISDLDAPQKNRLDAYNELKKISPDVVAGIRDENALTKESITLINSNAEARLQLLKLKIQEAGVTSVLTKNAEELATLQQELNVENQNYVASAKALQDAQKQTNVTGIAAVNVQQAAFSAFKSSASTVSELQQRIAALNKEQEGLLNQLQPIVKQTSAINAATQTRIDGLKETNKELQNQTKENDKFIKQNIADEIKRQKDAWKSINEAINENNQFLKTQLESNERLAKVYAKSQQEQANKNRIKALEEQALAAKNAEASFFALADAEMATGTTAVKDPLAEIKTLAPDLQKYTNFQNVLSGLTTTFFDPLSSLFENFLTTGKFTFQDFAKTVLATVKRLVAQLIATGILKLLASILTGGGSTAAGALGGAAKATKGIGGFLKGVLGGFLGGGVAAPQFGGVQAGALSMGGQVNLSLRGADLVGSINRTNTIINRIG